MGLTATFSWGRAERVRTGHCVSFSMAGGPQTCDLQRRPLQVQELQAPENASPHEAPELNVAPWLHFPPMMSGGQDPGGTQQQEVYGGNGVSAGLGRRNGKWGCRTRILYQTPSLGGSEQAIWSRSRPHLIAYTPETWGFWASEQLPTF